MTWFFITQPNYERCRDTYMNDVLAPDSTGTAMSCLGTPCIDPHWVARIMVYESLAADLSPTLFEGSDYAETVSDAPKSRSDMAPPICSPAKSSADFLSQP